MNGTTRTRAGHLRYTSPKKLRNKYVHRVKVEELIEETPYSIRLLLPWPYEVHHLDYNGANNEPSNLLIADVRLHSAMTVDGRARQSNGHFIPKYRKPPEWAEAACADDAPDWVNVEAVGGDA